MKKSASIHISVARQRLSLKRGRTTERTFPISTSRFGLGTKEGSYQTPTGRFRIAQKIGTGQPFDVAFQSRLPMQASAKALESDDLVMSRILWLDGLERDNANTFVRYIYIHGTNHEELIGQAASHGCIRMKRADVAELFDLVEVDTPVVITPPRRVPTGRRKVRKALRR